MTPEQYHAEVKKLGLTPSKDVPTVYLDSDGMTYNVKSPHGLTPEQRAEFIAMLKWRLGVAPKPDTD
jgi:hypothetical protein